MPTIKDILDTIETSDYQIDSDLIKDNQNFEIKPYDNPIKKTLTLGSLDMG